MSGKQSRAFTLIELLSVIAIIAVLATLMLPVLSKVRASAHEATCTSNLRMIHASLGLYASDHKGRLPQQAVRHGDGTTGGTWVEQVTRGGYIDHAFEQVWGYQGDDAARNTAFWCPVDDRSPAEGSGRGTSYLSVAGGGRKGKDGTVLGHRLLEFSQPARTMLLIEAYSGSGHAFPYWEAEDAIRYRHNDAAKVLYLDGHVSLITEEELTPFPDVSPDASDPQVFWGYMREGDGY